MRAFTITVLGPDRPGIVGSLSNAIAEQGGNWVESRLSKLAGHFAGILRVDIDEAALPKLTSALQGLEAEGLQIEVHPVSTMPSEPLRRTLLDVEGADRSGIVKEISRAIAAHGVNVAQLDAETGAAPWSGELLFRVRAVLEVPHSVSLETLRRSLEAIAMDLMVEAKLEEEPTDPPS
ncbi:MAG: ACT domain-containing protein [Myxococcota bacterium]